MAELTHSVVLDGWTYKMPKAAHQGVYQALEKYVAGRTRVPTEAPTAEPSQSSQEIGDLKSFNADLKKQIKALEKKLKKATR